MGHKPDQTWLYHRLYRSDVAQMSQLWLHMSGPGMARRPKENEDLDDVGGHMAEFRQQTLTLSQNQTEYTAKTKTPAKMQEINTKLYVKSTCYEYKYLPVMHLMSSLDLSA